MMFTAPRWKHLNFYTFKDIDLSETREKKNQILKSKKFYYNIIIKNNQYK